MTRSTTTGGATARVRARGTCRICGARGLQSIVDLGRTPLANAFVPATLLKRAEPRFPLRLARCPDCGLVQLRDVVDRSLLFRKYLYFSSSSGTMPAHFAGLVEAALRRHGGKTPGLAVEIGSNDGTLLRNLLGTTLRPLGIEPARNIAQQANERGIPTWNEFFSKPVAERILREHGPARLVFSNNVLAHIDDVHEVASAAARLLEEDGAWIIEVPHLAEMMRRVEFDTIYHEHLSYFSLPPLERLFLRHGLLLVDVQQVPVHGGSLRLTVQRQRPGRKPRASVARVRAYERRLGLSNPATYRRFRTRVHAIRRDLPRLLRGLRHQGHRIVGYGAPAKGNTLLNYCRIDGTILDYILDTTPAKQGLFTPGTHVPIREPGVFHRDPPTHALLLAWNFEREILAKERGFLRAGGRFIRPVPRPAYVPPKR